MDILAHGLYGGALSKIISKKTKTQKPNFWESFFWGMFPDLFAFGFSTIWLFFQVIFLHASFPNFPQPGHLEDNPEAFKQNPVFSLSLYLYNYSHSLIIFALVFGIIWVLFKKPRLAMLAWPLHILCDIPTHTAQFYPTPVLWPIFDIKFSGISWGTPLFMVINYSVIILLYILLRRPSRDKKKPA